MKNVLTIFALAFALSVGYSVQSATIESYYFNLSNALIDLDPVGGEYYGEVLLEVTAPNTIEITVDPFDSLQIVDSQLNPISSPLVAGPNFGLQVFGMDIALSEDESEITDRYDIDLPTGWSISTDQNISEFGSFDFKFSGTGSTRKDPLEIVISPKAGEDLTGYEFNDVQEFIELNPDSYYFVAHIADFTVDPAFVERGVDEVVNSAYFATGPHTPEPATGAILVIGMLRMIRRRRS